MPSIATAGSQACELPCLVLPQVVFALSKGCDGRGLTERFIRRCKTATFICTPSVWAWPKAELRSGLAALQLLHYSQVIDLFVKRLLPFG